MNINPSDIATGLLGLGVIAGAVGLVALGGRDRTADQHDVADYHEPVNSHPPSLRRYLTIDQQRAEVIAAIKQRTVKVTATMPPAAGSVPLYAETVVAQVVRRYGDSPADIARRFLREIAAEQRDDLIWTSTADRDLVGVFPVVRAA